MRLRRGLVILALALVACTEPSSGGPTASVATLSASPTKTVSSGAYETPSSMATPVATEEALARARGRFVTDPPTIHGVYEVREANEPQPLRWEVWVRWPAFRVETTFQGEPTVVVTDDGKRFAYRQGEESGATRGLGEQAVGLIAPVLSFYGPTSSPCATERISGMEDVAGRPALRVSCPQQGSETWVDAESGLVLASRMAESGPGGETTTRYTSIEFDPRLDDAVFDAPSV